MIALTVWSAPSGPKAPKSKALFDLFCLPPFLPIPVGTNDRGIIFF